MDAQLILSTLGTPAVICGASALLFGGMALERARLSVWPQVHGIMSRRRVVRHASRNGRMLEPPHAELKRWCFENGVPYPPPPRVHESATARDSGPAKTVIAPAGVLAAPAASTDAHHGPVRVESGVCAPSDTWTAPAPSAVDTLISKALPESTLAPRERLLLSTARVIVAPQVQVADYLDYVRAHDLGKCPTSGRRLCTRSCDAWFAAYVRWANARGIETCAKNTFLKFLKAAPGVEKPGRPRIKGVNGNVIRLETPGRSPARKVHYTVLELRQPATGNRQQAGRRKAA